MRKIKLYIASSIDSYIASLDGSLDWLSNHPITPELNYGYDKFFESVNTVIMGGKTYRDILNMDVIYPYESKMSYIITRNQINSSKENIHFITDNIIGTISNLKKEQRKDIFYSQYKLPSYPQVWEFLFSILFFPKTFLNNRFIGLVCLKISSPLIA